MKIKIDSDVFDIVKRIKEIDEGYFVLFDTVKNRYELHNTCQSNSYCLTCPYDEFDSRFIDYIFKTKTCFIDNIVQDIDNNNIEKERKQRENAKDISNFMLREIYSFSNNSSKSLDDEKAFASKWR